MAAALSRVYAGLCRRDRLTSKECPFWLYLFCASVPEAKMKQTARGNCTFKKTKESFEEWEIQSKFIFDENEQEKSFFIKRLQF
jgi:hypothetical protein